MNLLSPLFWFNLRPGTMAQIYSQLLIALIIFLIVLAVCLFIAKRKKSVFKKTFISLYDFAISNAFFGLLLLFFNYEIVPFFSARFWFLLWLIIALTWLYYIIKSFKKLLIRRQQFTVTDEISKYLPK